MISKLDVFEMVNKMRLKR